MDDNLTNTELCEELVQRWVAKVLADMLQQWAPKTLPEILLSSGRWGFNFSSPPHVNSHIRQKY